MRNDMYKGGGEKAKLGWGAVKENGGTKVKGE